MIRGLFHPMKTNAFAVLFFGKFLLMLILCMALYEVVPGLRAAFAPWRTSEAMHLLLLNFSFAGDLIFIACSLLFLAIVLKKYAAALHGFFSVAVAFILIQLLENLFMPGDFGLRFEPWGLRQEVAVQQAHLCAANLVCSLVFCAAIAYRMPSLSGNLLLLFCLLMAGCRMVLLPQTTFWHLLVSVPLAWLAFIAAQMFYRKTLRLLGRSMRRQPAFFLKEA